jgi:hypothetical protein
MPEIKGMWDAWDADALTELARRWLLDLSGAPSSPGSDIGVRVVMMNSTASPEKQWTFILAAMALASSDDELGHIAAGPLEHLLAYHGQDYIERVEERSAHDPKFARTVTGVWKHLMTDDIWARVRAIQAGVSDRLSAYRD